MVELDDRGRVTGLVMKPLESVLRFGWSIAVWTPVFSRFMHEYLAASDSPLKTQELIVGDIILAALQEDLRVDGVTFPDDTCLDIGRPEDLVKSVREVW